MIATTFTTIFFALLSCGWFGMTAEASSGTNLPVTTTTTTSSSSTNINTNTTTAFQYYYYGYGGNSTSEPIAAKHGTTATAIFLGMGIAFLIIVVLVVYYILRTCVCTYVKKCRRSRRAAAAVVRDEEEGGGGLEYDDLSDISNDDDIFIDNRDVDGGRGNNYDDHENEQFNWGVHNHEDVDLVIVHQIQSPHHDEDGGETSPTTTGAGSEMAVGYSPLVQLPPSTPMNTVRSAFENTTQSDSNSNAPSSPRLQAVV